MEEIRIRFGHALPADALSDEEFLQAIEWNRKAPDELKHAARNGHISKAARLLQKFPRRASRKSRTKKTRAGGSADRQALWSRHVADDTERTVRLFSLWESFPAQWGRSASKMKAKRKRKSNSGPSALQSKNTAETRAAPAALLADYLDNLSAGDAPSAGETLVLLEMLLRAVNGLSAGLYWRLWRAALHGAVALEYEPDPPAEAEPQAERLLLAAGELPWEAGLMFQWIRGADTIRRRGQRVIRRELLDHTDTDGTPDAELIERLALWLAPLARSAEWAKTFRVPLWDAESDERFHMLMKVVAPLCRTDGRLALSNGKSNDVITMLATAARLAGWKPKSLPLSYLRTIEERTGRKSKRQSTRNGKTTKRKKWPVTQSDWARLACLRNDWSLQADTLVVAHHREKPSIDLSVLGTPILSGIWDLGLSIDGRPVHIAGDWTCSCWYSDEDGDYLELSTTSERSLQIDRQLLLSREEHFLLLADSIARAGQSRLDYVSRLPLVHGAVVRPDAPTRACGLQLGRLSARAFPLALPQDRARSTPGTLEPVDGGLELNQAAMGGLFAPLVIDWAPQRRRSPVDWRTLTVSENGQILGSAAAAGHRLRIGRYQILVYRSLRKSEVPRAVLGYHTSEESLIGRFDTDGEVEPILIVE